LVFHNSPLSDTAYQPSNQVPKQTVGHSREK
jgi:hypothetical protein